MARLPFDAIFFDMGYTLVWFHPSADEIVAQAYRDVGLPVTPEQLAQAFHRVWEEYYRDAASASFPATAQYDHDAWYEREREILHLLGSDDEAMLEAYARRVEQLFSAPGTMRLYDDALPVLTALREAGFRLGIISNWSWNLVDRCRQVAIESYFEVVVASAYAGCNKPHPGIFRLALERMGASAERSVHVGDSYAADVAGSRAAGMQAVLLDRQGTSTVDDVPVVHDLRGFVEWVKARMD
jgi:putative hydrolase of the HAD superfamily